MISKFHTPVEPISFVKKKWKKPRSMVRGRPVITGWRCRTEEQKARDRAAYHHKKGKNDQKTT